MSDDKPIISPEQRAAYDRVNTMLNRLTLVAAGIVVVVVTLMFFPQGLDLGTADQVAATEVPEVDPMEEGIVDGIHVETGFVVDEGWELVRANCTACHSSKLVTQNRADRAGWESMIRWMQETQKLWDLGENEPIILDYLAKHYAPQRKGRRAQLTHIEWYELEP